MSEELNKSLCGGIFQVSCFNAFRNTPLVARKLLRHLSHWNAGKYLETMMKTIRLLLPFVHGVDKFAIEQAVLLAKSHNATLAPLVLIQMPKERRKKGVRLEYLQQSMDFLENVKQKADW